MATAAEKEAIIERAVGGEYTEAEIQAEGNALNTELDRMRRDLLSQFGGSASAGLSGARARAANPPLSPPPGPAYYSDESPSRTLIRNGVDPTDSTLSSYSQTTDYDDLYNRAKNSYVANQPFAIARGRGVNTVNRQGLEDRVNAAEDTTNVESPRNLITTINDEFKRRVQSSDLGSVLNSEYRDTVEFGFRERAEAFIGGLVTAFNVASAFRNQQYFTPNSQEAIYQLATNNFIWTYYAYLQLNRGRLRSLQEVYDAIELDRIVQLFIHVRVRSILLEAIEDIPPAVAAVLADPTIPENDRRFVNGRELLRQEALREAQETLIPEEDRGSQEEQSRLRRLAEQAFLIDFLPEFAEQNQRARAPNYISPQNNAPYFNMIHGRTDTIVNRLMHDPALQEMDALRPSELAGLVPKIRLFKVFPDTETTTSSTETNNNQKTYVEQEVPFDNYVQPSEISSMLTNAFDRGRGVGLKSFDWRLEGRDPFTSRRDIFAELKLFFQSFDEVLRVRNLETSNLTTGPKNFRYIDLVNIGVVRQTREGAWNPDYYKLRVEVGWQDPGSNNSFLGSLQERQRKRDAIVNSKMVMYLTAIDHTIDINDQGNVTMNIEYVAWQEASYLDQDSDVLATEELKDLRLQRRAQIDRARRLCNEDEVQRIVEQFKRSLREERLNSYQKLLSKLAAEQNIYYVPVPVANLDAYINFGETGVNVRGINDIFNNSPNNLGLDDIDFSNVVPQGSNELARILNVSTTNLDDDGLLKAIQEITYDPSARDQNVQYFYFGDLIKVAIEQASVSTPPSAGQNPSAGMVGKLQKDLRILLGPISFKRTLKPTQQNLPAQTDFIYNINLADIPISVNFFGEWFLKQVVSEQRNTYPILVFIRDLANKMLSGILRNQSHGLGNVARQNLQLRSNFFSAAAATTGGDIIQDNFNIIPQGGMRAFKQGRGGDFTRLDVDGLSIANRPLLRAPNTDERAYHYMLIYAINTGATERLRGDYAADNERGIYHFGIGRDRGIFKSVSFSKTDLPYLREGRFEANDAEAAATGLTILANVYEIEVKMFGNTMFAPGMKIFLNPSGIAPMLGSPARPYSPANLLGIGGYHVVTGVRSYIEGGKFETSMKAIFEASGARGTLGFSGAEQTGGREEECDEEIGARSLSESPTPVDRVINTGPTGDN